MAVPSGRDISDYFGWRSGGPFAEETPDPRAKAVNILHELKARCPPNFRKELERLGEAFLQAGKYQALEEQKKAPPPNPAETARFMGLGTETRRVPPKTVAPSRVKLLLLLS